MLRVTALAAIVLTLGSTSAQAQTPQYPDVIPIGQVKAGMKGYGLTVFRGTTIEKFDVTVVGVVKKGSLIVPGHDMILVQMKGGPMTERKANLIRGMSGSPVYINDKVIGAFSMGEPTTTEPLGGVTPIEDMLEAWDPRLPKETLTRAPRSGIRVASFDQPLVAGSRTIRKVLSNVPLSSNLRSNGSTLVMHPCTTLMSVSSMSKEALAKLQKALQPYNVEVVQGGQSLGKKPGFKGAPLLPGAAFSMMLATGDVQAGATGTVSYRRGNKILGFGHPFLGIGPIEAPLTSAWIYDIYPLTAGSYKISSPGPVVGASSHDRNFSISGEIGRVAKTIPVTVDVRDLTTGRRKVFFARTVAHPNLYSSMVSSVVSSAVAEIRNTPGAAMAEIVTAVNADEIGQVTRKNVVFNRSSIDSVATADLDDLLGIFTSNPFYPLGIKSASVKVEIRSGFNTAQVERVFLKEGKYEPGETIELGVVLKPYKKPAVTKTVKLTVPANLPSGRYPIQVRGGAVPAPLNFGGFIIRSAPQQNMEQAPPVSVRQMVNRYNEREKNNDLVVRMVLPTTAVNVEGEKLTDLPPSLDVLLRTSKSSGVRLERDEVKEVLSTEWVVSGTQLVNINIQRKESREAPQGGRPSGAPPGFQPMGSGGGGSFSAVSGVPDEDEQTIEIESGGYPFARIQNVRPAAPSSAPQTPPAAAVTGPPAQGAPVATQIPPTVVPDALTTEKPVVRIASVWRQMTRTDFASGAARGVSVTTYGDLRLARSLQKVHNTTEGFLWTLIPDGEGRLLAGTGSQGRVLRIGPNGSITTVAQLPEVSVHSLVRTPDEIIYAATAPHGRTYRIEPNGKFQVAHQAKEKYVLTLARDSKGNVYAGTGGGGTIYKIPPTGTATTFFKTPAQHVLSLAVDSSDNLYAGTATDGLVYRITPQGQGTVLFDAPEQSITSVAVSSTGSIYAATAPKGMIYKIDPDGGATTIYDKSATPFTALVAADNGTLYAAAGSTVYVIGNDRVAALENQLDVDILSLALSPDGTVFAGTGNVAEIYAALPVGQQQSGTYESVVHDAKQRSRWGAVRWTASTPSGTNVGLQTRSGNVVEPDATWSSWETVVAEGDSSRIVSPAARYIQYRVMLSSSQPGSTPALRDISISYLPKNLPPTVAFQAPVGGERWARNQTVRWQATDPEKDTLNYQLFYSRDNGGTWQPVPGGTTTSQGTSGTAPPAGTPPTTAPPPARLQPPQSVAEVSAVLDSANPPIPAELRSAILAQAKALNDEWARQAGAQQSTSQPVAVPITPSRESSKSVDTRNLGDGVYILKVVATDRPSNAMDFQTAEAISESFVVSNTAPVVTVLKSPAINPDGTVTLTGSAVQNLIPITAVQFRVGNGEWLAAAPNDGIFDGRFESFTLTTASLPKGSHTIEVKAFNAASLIATDKASVEIK